MRSPPAGPRTALSSVLLQATDTSIHRHEVGRYRSQADRSSTRTSSQSIEHIGSTSVPGLAANPVIDIVTGIDDPTTRRRNCRTSSPTASTPGVRELRWRTAKRVDRNELTDEQLKEAEAHRF